MKFKMNKKNGIKLLTANKYCKEDMEIVLDDTSDAYLTPTNIRKGVSILGVVGELHEGTDALVYVDEEGSLVLQSESISVDDEGSLNLS